MSFQVTVAKALNPEDNELYKGNTKVPIIQDLYMAKMVIENRQRCCKRIFVHRDLHLILLIGRKMSFADTLLLVNGPNFYFYSKSRVVP